MISRYCKLLYLAYMCRQCSAANVPRQEQASITDTITSATSTDISATISSSSITTTLSPISTSVSLSPWISFNPSGQAVTIVPSVITSDGTTRTIDLAPTATLLTPRPADTLDAPVLSPIPACGAGSYAQNGSAAPFCLPQNGTQWVVDTMYAITWDPTFWNGTQRINIALISASDNDTVLMQTGSVNNTRGFYTLLINESWIGPADRNPANLYIAPEDGVSDPTYFGSREGPQIFLQRDYFNPAYLDATTTPKSIVALAAIVAVLGLALISLCVIWSFRRHRTLNLSDVHLSRRGGGYLDRKSRKQRMGRNAGRDGDDVAGLTGGSSASDGKEDGFEMGNVSGYSDREASTAQQPPASSRQQNNPFLT